MQITEKFTANTPEAWRAWLSEHHQEKQEIWLVLYKASSGKQGLTLPGAQEEALCFGWVDSLSKSIDAECYGVRFTPRRKTSHWTDGNTALALRLLREGRVAQAGLASLPPDVLQAWEQEKQG